MIKDRYTWAFLFLFTTIVLSVYAIRNERESAASALLSCGILPLLYLFTRGARVHLSENQMNHHQPEYKGELDCGFSPHPAKHLDGIKINGLRYKLVNGTDSVLSASGSVVPAGPGSAFMQWIGAGGAEPKSIQNNPCW
jgi:hypothetical protein